MPYVYSADVFCDQCGDPNRPGHEIPKPTYPKPWDTDDYPDYVQTLGPTDSPQNCGECGAPLDYELTEEGIKYVLDHIQTSLETALKRGRANTWDRIMPLHGTGEETMHYWHGSRHVEIVRDWADKISGCNLEKDEAALVSLFLDLSDPTEDLLEWEEYYHRQAKIRHDCTNLVNDLDCLDRDLSQACPACLEYVYLYQRWARNIPYLPREKRQHP
jgi:hypothetical protein